MTQMMLRFQNEGVGIMQMFCHLDPSLLLVPGVPVRKLEANDEWDDTLPSFIERISH